MGHIRVYKDGKLVRDEIHCHCGLAHKAPMTHELHELLVLEHEAFRECVDCEFAGYSPHIVFTDALFEYFKNNPVQ